MKTRKHVYFSGSVQGVGFRYRAYYAAESLGLTGWVKNLWDGRVEMEVQGEPEAIYRLYSMLQEGHYIAVSHVEEQEIPLEEEGSFRIRG